MRYSYVAAPLALAAGVSAHPAANGTIAYTTEVVTAFTTFCPSATEVVHGGSTYTVTEVRNFDLLTPTPDVCRTQRLEHD